MTTATPVAAPVPVNDFLKPSARDQSQIAADSCTATALPCSIPVQVGLFFDGTNNNMYRDREGERIGVPHEKTKVPAVLPSKQLKPEECSHSNVARLFRVFPANKQTSGYFRYYIQGVGTRFKDIGELTETQEGKAFAKGGQSRIVWGLLQVLNALHSTIDEKKLPLYKDAEAGQLAQSYEHAVGQAEKKGNTEDQRQLLTHRDWFSTHIDKLKAALAIRPKPSIPSLTVSVFGFSRGAAEAAAFCHLFGDLLEGGKFAGIAARINFLGVFDTVATVGGSASIGKSLALPDAIFDGHWAWAKHILKPLPGCVEAGLHCIAAHEQRMNFPVTQLRGSIEEIYFPGVHSDVGGGYAPGEQGKGRGSQSALLSQIPLLHMFKAARLAGVPLIPYSELEATIQDDFQVSDDLKSSWEAYTAALGQNGGKLIKHMELSYRWRAARRLNALEATASFKAASGQDQQDLRDANRMLEGDLKALGFRRTASPGPNSDNDQFLQLDQENTNLWHFAQARNRTGLEPWEKDALAIFTSPEPLPAGVMRFFDDYVHDSLAGFYMAGPVTEYDKLVHVAGVRSMKNPENLKGFNKRVFDITKQTEDAQAKKKNGEPLSRQEETLVSQAEHGTPFPIMKDSDSADMRSSLIRTQTDTRREGGGYILRRGYYPRSGFWFFFRRSINEKDLQSRPVSYIAPKGKALDDVTVELVWSDNLLGDIANARVQEQVRLADQVDATRMT